MELKTKGQFLKSTVVITDARVVLFPDSVTMSHEGQALFTHPDTQGKFSLVHKEVRSPKYWAQLAQGRENQPPCEVAILDSGAV